MKLAHRYVFTTVRSWEREVTNFRRVNRLPWELVRIVYDRLVIDRRASTEVKNRNIFLIYNTLEIKIQIHLCLSCAAYEKKITRSLNTELLNINVVFLGLST